MRSFFDILDKKDWFLDQKIKVLKSAKHEIFLRGWSMVFVQKPNFFHLRFFGVIKSEKNVFFLYSG